MLESLESKLRTHQVASVAHLVDVLQHYQSAVDLSDMGVGKMYVGAAVAARLQLPTVVVAPKIVESAWRTAAEHFGERFTIVGYEKLRTGNTEIGRWENPLPDDPSALEYFQCQCCQCKIDPRDAPPCYTHPLGIHCLELRRKSWNYGKFLWHPGVGFVIFDEVQRCGGLDSLNAELLIGVKRQNIKMLGLSATAACNPLAMRALGYNLDLHNDRTDLLGYLGKAPYVLRSPNFYRWANRYGCRRDPRFHGFKWLVGEARQRETMVAIRDSILPARGVRVTTDEIPGFPECDVAAELYDLDESGRINEIYQEMAASLGMLAERESLDGDSPLTKILRARQRIELLKVPIAVELCNDLNDQGYSVGLFVNFSQTVAELRARLKCDCVIDGSAATQDRERSVARFQTHESRRIILNAEAGGSGLSLPDLDGFHPRAGIVFPGVKADTFRQLLGRFRRENSRSKSIYRVIFAAGTYDEVLCRIMRTKLNNLDALNDADLDGRSSNLHLLRVAMNN